MKVGWIFPFDERCGISRYANDYLDCIGETVPIVRINPRWWFTDRKILTARLKECTLIHVQYDTLSFMMGHCDGYRAIMHAVRVPAVVSLHEVYDKDPEVFPRQELRGIFPIVQIRRIIWDVRHPVQCVFHNHLKHRFFARKILVHHRCQKEILLRKGIEPSLVQVSALPVMKRFDHSSFIFNTNSPFRFGGLGFINPAYDYELLFNVLKRFDGEWSFTWIGGVRKSEQLPLLEMIRQRVEREGWEKRFRITGWLTEENVAMELGKTDLMLALFRYRSSSASIGKMMGAGKPVVATDLPLTREMAAGTPNDRDPCGEPNSALLIVPPDAESVVAVIRQFIADENVRKKLYRGLCAYVDEVALEKRSRELINLYGILERQ